VKEKSDQPLNFSKEKWLDFVRVKIVKKLLARTLDQESYSPPRVSVEDAKTKAASTPPYKAR